MPAERPERPDTAALLKRDYSPLLASIGCVSFLVILGLFAAGIGLMFDGVVSTFTDSVDASSQTLWGGACLFVGGLLIWLIERILKLIGVSQQEFIVMTLSPFSMAMINLVNWRNRIAHKPPEALDVTSSREFYAEIKAKARTRDAQVQESESDNVPALDYDTKD